MGMFDKVNVECKLPDLGYRSDIQFQTKDFDCVLDDYTVTDLGRLKAFKIRYDENKKRIITNQFVNFTGSFEIHYYDDKEKLDLKYALFFERGYLKNIMKIEPKYSMEKLFPDVGWMD